MTKIGYIRIEEFAAPLEHAECEADRHKGYGIPASYVFVKVDEPGYEDSVWGMCAECWELMNSMFDEGDLTILHMP